MSDPRPSRPVFKTAALGALTLALSAAVAGAVRSRLDRAETAPAADEVASSRSDRGSLLYEVHCARCHGREGHGDGADAPLLKPPPRDFAAEDRARPLTAELVRRRFEPYLDAYDAAA